MISSLYDKELKDHVAAFNEVKYILSEGEHKVIDSFDEIDAIGHRIVQGGDRYTKSVLVTEKVVKDVEELAPLAPLHNPAHLMGYRACLEVVGPDVPQVFVFDTSFHSTILQRHICMLFLTNIMKNMLFAATVSTARLISSFLTE